MVVGDGLLPSTSSKGNGVSFYQSAEGEGITRLVCDVWDMEKSMDMGERYV